MASSDVAEFRKQQAAQETAANLALHGPAMVARHDFMTARAERGAVSILQLIEQGKHEEAQALMMLPDWGVGGEPRMSHFDVKPE
jgi:hypothetical protein